MCGCSCHQKPAERVNKLEVITPDVAGNNTPEDLMRSSMQNLLGGAKLCGAREGLTTLSFETAGNGDSGLPSALAHIWLQSCQKSVESEQQK